LAETSDEEVAPEVELEAGQVPELDGSAVEEIQQVSTFGEQQVPEKSESVPVAEQTYELEEEFEQGFGGGETSQSEGTTPSSGALEIEAPASFEMRETPIEVIPTPLPPARGTTQPMKAGGEAPSESAPADGPTQEMPAESDGPPLPQPGMSTATLGELYASQGHFEEALGVYRELVASHPDDSKFRRRVEELSMLTNAQTEDGARAALEEGSYSGTEGQALRETIRILEGWLAAMRKP